MKTQIEIVVSSKTRWWQVMILLITTLLTTTFIYILIIPLTLWGMYGSGASSDSILESPFAIFIAEWLPLILALTFLILSFYINLRKGNLGKAKSFIIVAPVLLISYLFRVPILNVMFDIFQS
ncbi:MAG: hypothetical protein WKF66_14595 [Pedobacter sp.]